ncbi:hypothetical protein QEN19_001721 [Hanseniaspora menglaensis]
MNFYKFNSESSLNSLRIEAIKGLVQISYDDDNSNSDVSILETTKSQLTTSFFNYGSNGKKDYSNLKNFSISSSELEIIFGICDTVPKTASQCRSLIGEVIQPYFTNASKQLFSDVVVNKFHPSKSVVYADSFNEGYSVYEILSFKLTKFLIVSHGKFVELRSLIENLFANFFNSLNSNFVTNNFFVILGVFRAASKTPHVSNIHEKLVVSGWKFSLLYESKFRIIVENDIGNELLSSYYEHGYEIGSTLFLKHLLKVQYNVINSLFNNSKNESFVESLLSVTREKEINPSAGEQKYKEKIGIFEENHLFLNYVIYQSLEKLQALQKDNLSVTSLVALNNIFEIQDILLQTCSLNLLSLKENTVDSIVDILKNFIKNYTTDSFLPHMSYLSTVVSFLSLLNYYTEAITSELVSFFPVLISNKFVSIQLVQKISRDFAMGLPALTEDAVVGSVYDISNLLGDSRDKYLQKRKLTLTNTLGDFSNKPKKKLTSLNTFQSMNMFSKLVTKKNSVGHLGLHDSTAASHGSALSSNQPEENDMETSSTDEYDQLEKVVLSLVTISSFYKDNSVSVLILTILIQKFNSVSSQLDTIILKNLHVLALTIDKNEFTLVIKFLQTVDSSISSIENQKNLFESKLNISRALRNIGVSQSIYFDYLNFLLESISTVGSEKTHKKGNIDDDDANVTLLTEYLHILSEMLPREQSSIIEPNEHILSLLRDLWINLATHGFYYDNKSRTVLNCNSVIISLNSEMLSVIALNTPALAAYNPCDTSETSYKLKSILHRKVSSKIIEIQEKAVKKELGLSGSFGKVEILFITAVTMLESQRLNIAPEIAITTMLLYSSDESVKNDFGIFCENMAKKMCFTICSSKQFRTVLSLQRYSGILNSLLLQICSRNKSVQKSAYAVADKLISYLPEALNHKNSIFLCLDLLSTLYQAYYDVSKNKYELLVEYNVNLDSFVSLPLSESWRKETLNYYEQHCCSWFTILLSRTPDTTKAMLHHYVSTKSDTNYVKLHKFNYGVSFARNQANSLDGGEVDPESFINRQINHGLKLSNHAWTALDSTIEFFTASSLTQLSDDSLLWVQYKKLKFVLLQEEDNETKVASETVPLFLNICSKLLNVSLQNKEHEKTAAIVVDLINGSFFKGTESDNLSYGITIWKRLVVQYPELNGLFLTELVKIWELHVNMPNFILNINNGFVPCEEVIMEYTPSNTKTVIESSKILLKETNGYLQLFKFIEEMSIKTLQFTENFILSDSFVQFIKVTLDVFKGHENNSIHPSLKFLKFRLLKVFYKLAECCFKRIAKSSTATLFTSKNLSALVSDITVCTLKLFSEKSLWPFGNDELEWDQLYYTIRSLYKTISTGDSKTHSGWLKFLQSTCGDELNVLEMFLAHEIYTISVWQEPSVMSQYNGTTIVALKTLTEKEVKKCFQIDIKLTANLIERYLGEGGVGSDLLKERVVMWELFGKLVNTEPIRAAKFYGPALKYLTEDNMIKYGTLFDSVDPMTTINYLLPVGENKELIKSSKTKPIMLQYFMKSLESYSSQVSFFYIPQIVQCLRYDDNGYVERFILDSGMINSYFAHQIIWNMKANKYKDDQLLEIDPVLGPKLYTITEKIEKSFDKAALDFYKKEFSFFTEVTEISGTLKEYIKYSKPEKKQVIDREMAKITVLPGVYLPSNPDGVVVDIDRKSGKPLQSHAKAPFIATFKIEKKTTDGEPISQMQSAIFKVGDDCRQDVLALQLINCCKSIWMEVGLDIYVFPYRVTATDGGCGVIDVLPNSISRDMLGREAVNGLYEWFVSKFGSENSKTFEAARLNFIKSLAGYSVISYLLQFKDRHNGNIMYDDFGHILHIDFGFIFDIVPGGVKFEAVPFKLTKEMVRVLGGSKDSLGFKLFERLTVKAFLSLRKHFKFLQNTIEPMLDSNLPCFKGKTIKNMHARMALDKSEKEAAHFMLQKISRSYESSFTKGYDEFQRLTNGIPY